MNTYEVVVRETVEQTFLVEAPTAAAAHAAIQQMGWGHDGCVDWEDFIATENPDVEFATEKMIQRTVRDPKKVR